MHDDYYPFGLTFNEYQNQEELENDFLYNDGAEREDDLGLNIDFTIFRNYDPTLGRWWQVDPQADASVLVDWTPYNYSFNNPIRWNDPMGDCPDGDCEKVIREMEAEWEAISEDVSEAVGSAIEVGGKVSEIFFENAFEALINYVYGIDAPWFIAPSLLPQIEDKKIAEVKPQTEDPVNPPPEDDPPVDPVDVDPLVDPIDPSMDPPIDPVDNDPVVPTPMG